MSTKDSFKLGQEKNNESSFPTNRFFFSPPPISCTDFHSTPKSTGFYNFHPHLLHCPQIFTYSNIWPGKSHNLGLDPFPSTAAPLNSSHDGTKPEGCGWGLNLHNSLWTKQWTTGDTWRTRNAKQWYLLRGKWGKLITVIREDSKTGIVWPSTETGLTIPSDYQSTWVKIVGFQGKKENWCSWGNKKRVSH